MSDAFQSFVAPARSSAQLWRLALGLTLALVVYLGWILGLLWTGWILAGASRGPLAWAASTLRADTPAGALILLATFVGMALGPMAAVRWVHRRPVATLIGPRDRALRDFAVAAGVTGIAGGVSLAIWALVHDAVPNLEAGTWILLLPLTVAGLAVQTGAEEMVFRGYFQQQLAARFRSPLVWLVLPSLGFGLTHYDPTTAGPNAVVVVVSATCFGMIAADLTARSGTLGAAWGLHLANNVLAIAVVPMTGTLSGLGLYVTPYAIDTSEGVWPIMMADVAVLVLVWIVLRRCVGR